LLLCVMSAAAPISECTLPRARTMSCGAIGVTLYGGETIIHKQKHGRHSTTARTLHLHLPDWRLIPSIHSRQHHYSDCSDDHSSSVTSPVIDCQILHLQLQQSLPRGFINERCDRHSRSLVRASCTGDHCTDVQQPSLLSTISVASRQATRTPTQVEGQHRQACLLSEWLAVVVACGSNGKRRQPRRHGSTTRPKEKRSPVVSFTRESTGREGANTSPHVLLRVNRVSLPVIPRQSQRSCCHGVFGSGGSVRQWSLARNGAGGLLGRMGGTGGERWLWSALYAVQCPGRL
jgi:hypothetical protein